MAVHVGGVTATNIDFAHVLTDKLPIFIAIVVLFAFTLLVAGFRSLLIPVMASVMNLLSVAAALGAMNAVFSWGRGPANWALPNPTVRWEKTTGDPGKDNVSA